MILGLTTILSGVFFATHQVSASASFTGAQHAVVRSANFSNNPNQINWYAEGPTYASINQGQIAAVVVFYENTGTSAAQNVRIRLSPQNTSSATQHVFSGSVQATNTNPVSGSATVALNGSAQQLTHVPGSGMHHRSYGSSLSLSGTQINQLFSPAGLNIGTVQPGQAGGIVVHFTTPAVTPDPEPTWQDPIAQTLPQHYVTETSALFRGNYDGHGEEVAVRFQYSTSLTNLLNGSGTSVSWISQGSGSGIATRTVNQLQPNTTYHYHICVRYVDNPSIQVCGEPHSFTTHGEQVLSLTTIGANLIAEESAQLRGTVNEGSNVSVWFALTTSSNPSCTNNSHRYDVSGNYQEGDSVQYVVDGLQDNTLYRYRICGESSSGGNAQGAIQTFTTHAQAEQGLSISTQTHNSVTQNSVRLNGRVQTGQNATTWFAITTSSNPSCTNNSHRQNVTGTYQGGDSFDRIVGGLSSNTTYNYRACGQSSSGGNAQGVIRSFTTNASAVTPIIPEEKATVSACSVVSVGTGVATVRSAYVSETQGTGYFQYGTGGNFTSNTSSIAINGTGIDQRVLTGLQPGTTYTCRYVVINQAGSTFGGSTTFTTSAPVAPVTPSTPAVATTVISGGEGRLVTLVIDNDQEIATRGQIVRYVVEYGNISGRDLDQVGLLVRLPRAARFIASNQGSYNRRDHTVYYRIGTFREEQEGIMTIDVRIGAAREGEPIVAEAILAFENPIENAQNAFINAIEFDADTYTTGVGLGAGLFGFGFPTTFAEWILFLLIIVAVILLARYLYNRNRERNARIAMMQAQERAHQAKINEDMMRNGNNNGGYGNNR